MTNLREHRAERGARRVARGGRGVDLGETRERGATTAGARRRHDERPVKLEQSNADVVRCDVT